MSDILTINTEDSSFVQKKILPLPLYDDNYYMLNHVMEEYEDSLPNHIMSNLVERLKFTMKLYGGIGLSANQCGVAMRVFVIGTDQFQMTCINPKVIQQSEKLVKDNEGCLSFPGLFCKIERPERIEVEYTEVNGETKRAKLEGLTARCFLHELDHMNGVKFVQHVGPVTLQLAKQKQLKLIKKLKRKNKK